MEEGARGTQWETSSIWGCYAQPQSYPVCTSPQYQCSNRLLPVLAGQSGSHGVGGGEGLREVPTGSLIWPGGLCSGGMFS